MLEQNFKISSDQVIYKVALALLISLVLHGVIIVSVKIKPAKSGGTQPPVLEARLVSALPEHERIVALDPSPATDRHADGVEAVAAETPIAPKPVAESKSDSTAPVPASAEKSIMPTLDIPFAEDLTYYPAKQLDVHPATLYPISPQYPQAAEIDNVAGEVTLLLLIDEFGIVREASVVEAKPEGYFEESALNAFRAARFKPAQKDGRDVKSRALIRIQYQAKDWHITPGTSLKLDK